LNFEFVSDLGFRASDLEEYIYILLTREVHMKLIIAIIQPDKLEEVKEELYKKEVNLITVSEVLGHGRQKGITEIYRGAKETGNLLRKIRLEIAVNEGFVEPTVKAIIKGAKTGETGDGKIFILDLKECVRIRTEERGNRAIG
jgi:nitrogen regulatory protein P-II 2